MTNIKHKELVRLLAEKSDLYIYQVEDCLNALAVVVSQKLSEGLSVQVKGVGSLSTRSKPSRLVKSNLKGIKKEYSVEGTIAVKFKVDSALKNALNNAVNQ